MQGTVQYVTGPNGQAQIIITPAVQTSIPITNGQYVPPNLGYQMLVQPGNSNIPPYLYMYKEIKDHMNTHCQPNPDPPRSYVKGRYHQNLHLGGTEVLKHRASQNLILLDKYNKCYCWYLFSCVQSFIDKCTLFLCKNVH